MSGQACPPSGRSSPAIFHYWLAEINSQSFRLGRPNRERARLSTGPAL